MKIKMFIVAIAALIVTTSSAFAQQRGGGQQRDCDQMSKERTERLKKDLKLDAKQEKSALEIFTKYCKETQETMKGGNNNREKFAEIREKTDKEINAILTPDQQKTWKEQKEKAAKERGNGTGPNRGGEGGRGGRPGAGNGGGNR